MFFKINNLIGTIFFTLSLQLISLTGNTQLENQQKNEKIVPMSPNAASLGKYGEIPVNYYNGSITVPIQLYNITSGKHTIPISLSYNYTGLKVEEISGNVGLGWSLNAGGVISRTVRGLPDEEGPNGYMVDTTMPIQYMIDHDDEAVKEKLKDAGIGAFDTEPDIFYYNFNGFSGKFYYSQQHARFFTIPNEKLNIEFDFFKAGFKIITKDGIQYSFEEKEITYTTQSCDNFYTGPGTNITTAWYLTKILDRDNSEIAKFSYLSGSHEFVHLNTITNYFLVTQYGDISPGISSQQIPPFNQSYCTQSSRISSKRIHTIEFRNGKANFIYSQQDRCDLPGDKFLKNIEIRDNHDNLMNRFKFEYGYFGNAMLGEGCSNMLEEMHFLRLKLKRILQEGSNAVPIGNPYIFEYNEIGPFPSRLSYAQDYWGYYNSANNNTSLIPPTSYVDMEGNRRFFTGADRLPNFNAASLGSLTKLHYPTTGYSEFSYENNSVKDDQLIPPYEWKQYHIEGDHNGGQQTYYERVFTIEEPPNHYNDNSPNGGAFVDIQFFNIGCVFPNGIATDCAILKIEKITGPGNSLSPITQNLEGYYFPNGTYKISATFNQAGPQMEDFLFLIRWKAKQMDGNGNSIESLVGGIRIKKIVDHDTYDNVSDQIRNFNYVSEQTGYSSGKVFSYPFDFNSIFHHEFLSGWNVSAGCVIFYLYREFIKRSSHSSYPLSSASGSNFVGYQQVNIEYDLGGIGRRSYYFNNYPDLINEKFPQTLTNHDWMRGHLEREKIWDTYGNLKSEINHTLGGVGAGHGENWANGIKLGFNSSIDRAGCGDGGMYYIQRKEVLRLPLWNEYPTYSSRIVELGNTKIDYEGNQSSTGETEQYYNEKNFLVNRMETKNSVGKKVGKIIQYNCDYSSVNGNPSWISGLNQKGIFSLPIEELSFIKDQSNQEFVIGGTLTIYKTGTPYVDKVFMLEVNQPIPVNSFQKSHVNALGHFVMDSRYELSYEALKYDGYGNILERKFRNQPNEVFLWGYRSEYPIAKIIGSNYDIVNSVVNQSNIDNATNIDSNDEGVRGLLGTIRTSFANTPNVQVMGYTYRPLLGVTSETDINGNNIYYEYNQENKLKTVKDQNGNILKKYCYNYAGQPINCGGQTFLSQSYSANFQRNNCGAGFTGSTVAFSVPDGMFSSTISPEDAQQKAIDYANANGQAYANDNGTCTPNTNCDLNTCFPTGADPNSKKCINGQCYIGVKVYYGNNPLNFYECRYRYEWWDGSASIFYQEPSYGLQCPTNE
jgi:hypothetical protein